MHDLALPPPVSLWPATPAWYALGVLVLLGLLWLAWRGWRAWRRNAYRREALAALETAQAPVEIAVILKRTALAAWPRAQVAALAGAEWAALLRSSAPRARLTDAMARLMADLSYQSTMPAGVRDAARRWIRLHDVRA